MAIIIIYYNNHKCGSSDVMWVGCRGQETTLFLSGLMYVQYAACMHHVMQIYNLDLRLTVCIVDC